MELYLSRSEILRNDVLKLLTFHFEGQQRQESSRQSSRSNTDQQRRRQKQAQKQSQQRQQSQAQSQAQAQPVLFVPPVVQGTEICCFVQYLIWLRRKPKI